MTVKRLFWVDPYQTNCTSSITSIDGRNITLDQTVFYAFSGGQISDSGTIHGIEVINATITQDNDIVYQLASPLNCYTGDLVNVEIDWSKRYELMKLHTAQHIVADFFSQETGMNINSVTGSNVRVGKATLTYQTHEKLTDILKLIESKINKYITENHVIQVWNDPAQPDRRYWKCNTFECPCGGTHVKYLHEIGQIKLKRKSGGKEKEVIEITLQH